MAFKDKMEGLAQKAAQHMQGRYGYDQLGMVMVVASIVFMVLNFWFSPWALIIAWVLLIAETVRMWSKNHAARQRENLVFLNLVNKPSSWFKRQQVKRENRDTKAYVRCPHCRTEFSLPKGKGKLRATCPKCGKKSVHTV